MCFNGRLVCALAFNGYVSCGIELERARAHTNTPAPPSRLHDSSQPKRKIESKINLSRMHFYCKRGKLINLWNEIRLNLWFSWRILHHNSFVVRCSLNSARSLNADRMKCFARYSNVLSIGVEFSIAHTYYEWIGETGQNHQIANADDYIIRIVPISWFFKPNDHVKKRKTTIFTLVNYV